MARPIRCLITAGPTREFFDPVRFLSNPSSGKMGYALAAAAVAKGCDTTLISGPVSLPTPVGIKRIDVITGDDMFVAVESQFEQCDLLIMTAAVMDYRPEVLEKQKIKKTDSGLNIRLLPVRDILKTMGWKKRHQCVVGFAAETDSVIDYAKRKLHEKNCDFLVANQVGVEGLGFGTDQNLVWLLNPLGNGEQIGPDDKTAIASVLMERFLEHMKGSGDYA
jgi:phosphopantothenoylcysteine decarboxylase/phosphopantothenate--cysteine ligase